MSEESDQAFAGGQATAFANGTLPVEAMTHRLHVRLTWQYLRRWSLLTALERMTADTRRFTEVHGATGKYHETITWAWVLVVHERMQNDVARGHDTDTGWAAFARRHPDLLTPDPSILTRYYTAATLDSAVARARFVLPDRGISATKRAPANP